MKVRKVSKLAQRGNSIMNHNLNNYNIGSESEPEKSNVLYKTFYVLNHEHKTSLHNTHIHG